MFAYVTRFTFPDDPEVIADMIGDGEDPTDLEFILLGKDVNWALPKSAMVGHTVWFQFSKRSITNARRALAAARRDGLSLVEVCVEELMPLIERYAGCVIAVGRVAGPPANLGDQGRHFRGRIFAEVDRLYTLPMPVEAVNGAALTSLTAFSPTGPVTNRVFSDDLEYRAALSIIDKAPNRVPAFAKRRITGPIPVDDPLEWSKAIRGDVGFVSEAQVEGFLAIPLLREIADPRPVVRQVGVIKNGKSVGTVDAIAWFGGTLLPIEYKLRAETEAALAAQLARYSGPATIRWTEEANTHHPYVLVIDNDGAQLYRAGKASAGGPRLKRKDFSLGRLRQFREDLRSVLSAA